MSSAHNNNSLQQSKSDAGAVAVKFLIALHGPPWLLFHHDGKFLGCVVAKMEADIRHFVATYNGRTNLNYLPKLPADPWLAKKPTKEQIGEIWFLHGDQDRGDHEGRVEAKQRCRANLDAFPIPPHYVVDTDNGDPIRDAIDAAEGVLRDPLSDLQISNSRSFLSVPSVSVEAA